MIRRRKILFAFAALVISAAALVAGLGWLDRAYPPPLPERLTISTEVLDRDGELLRAYATPDGYWRLNTRISDVDPKLIKMLIAYEDKRFYEHGGIDPAALGRAALQLITNQRIVSGGSTLSMQLARLIEPRRQRSLGSKLLQLARAIQIERRLSKDEILERYLTLAPYGGNLEGVRSAALAYFNKEPRSLTSAEAALLVALPQLPERRRPDRAPDNARKARDRVLSRVAEAGVITHDDAERARLESVPTTRAALPALAAHFADLALRKAPMAPHHKLTLKKSVQTGLEAAAREAAQRLGPKVSVAMVLADSRTGEILGEVGSADYFDGKRQGWIDMTRAIRSPGSTLKPFIYGLAFEEGLIAQETIISDRPSDFSGYRPRNFDMSYQGDVSIRQALQMSLNVPAISLLDAVGPVRLTTRFRQAGVTLQLPRGEAPGLAIGLGGAGISLRDLVQLYTGLANGGRTSALRDGTEPSEPASSTAPILDERATWQIGDILSGVVPPPGAPHRGIAYKTGTSYGYRDAWSVGYDGRHVLGVWVGRADGGSVPGISGFTTAAPILFDAFTRSGVAIVPLPRAPAGALRTPRADLPVTLTHFTATSEALPVVKTTLEPAPRIVFPPDGAHIALSDAQDGTPLVLKLQGGRAPFRWLANDKPFANAERRRTATWQPDSTGSSTLTVIDAAGRAASVKVVVE
ncbi:penicillin-binding protein 1C [Daeguia caeni]|uniref:peptidoglycan glycosyltransferase n=1 Tax=Daeguia caeni TaxID=439612 RepID=A0ABV9H6E6_9HYPH